MMSSVNTLPVQPPGIGGCRSDFPVLDQTINGHALVYLDNAATTQKPVQVLQAMDSYYRQDNSNVHRGMHPLSRRATAGYEGARKTVSRFLRASDPATVVFTRGTTESINLVAQSFARPRLEPGSHILVGEWEHHSNMIPWFEVARQTGATVSKIPLDTDFSGPDPKTFRELLERKETKFLAITCLSNSLGITLPVGEICRQARAANVITVLDAAQAAAHLPLDVTEWDCDFLAFSGHKCGGPTGIGVLYGKPEHLEAMLPYQTGGEMIDQVSFESVTWKKPPHRFEAGTPPIAEAIGLAAALDYLSALGLDAVAGHDYALGRYALEVLPSIPGIRFLSPKPVPGPLVSFNLEGVHPHDAADLAGEEGVALRAGHHCCQPLMRKCQIPGTLRASWFVYNTPEEIDRLTETLTGIGRFFQKGSRSLG